jgi:hypothetical protein
MSRIITRKRALLGVVASLAIAATAFAYWTTTGSGTGSGSVKASNGTITLSGAIDGPLAPGENSDVTIKASNAGTTDLYVTSTTLSNINAAALGCADGDFTVTAANVAQGVIVPAGASNQTLPSKHNIKFANSASNQDACKSTGISFDLASN